VELRPKEPEKPEKERTNDFERIHGDRLRELLDPDETLLGVAAVNWQKSVFRQTVSALGVTERRLVFQPLDHKGRFDGESPLFIARDEIAKGSYGAGGGGDSPASLIMSSHSIDVKIKTRDGRKFKFMLMTGKGILGGLGGGPSQRQGAKALVGFLDGDSRQ